jgi:predicted amidohydrolase
MRILAMFWSSAVIALCLLLTPVSTAKHKPAPAPIVITHATVINPGASSVEANQTVVITGDHITSVSDTAKFQSPKNVRGIDATGQYLIPGLWDMHVHSAFGDWFPGGREIILPLFIANGVTGVRDMGGEVPLR